MADVDQPHYRVEDLVVVDEVGVYIVDIIDIPSLLPSFTAEMRVQLLHHLPPGHRRAPHHGEGL